MASSIGAIEWKGEERSCNHSQDPQSVLGGAGFIAAVPCPSLADDEFIKRASWEAAMRYAAQRCELDDYEIADEMAVSHGYMSKVLKGAAGFWGRRLVKFMRSTRSLAPLQWLAEQMGCDVIPRSKEAATIRALEEQIAELKRRAA